MEVLPPPLRAMTRSKSLVGFASFALTIGSSFGADLVLDGKPTYQCSIAGGESACVKLRDDQQRANRTLIVSDENRFFWKSRGGRELVRSISGIYTVYSEVSGAGFVKIDAAGEYVEVVHIGLRVMTYSGRAD